MQSNNENSLNDQISSSNYRLRQQPWQHLHRLEEHLRSEDQCWGPFRILRGRGEQPSVFQGSQWDHRELQQAGHGRQRRLVRTEWTVQLRKKLLAFIEDFLLIYVSWKIDCVPDSRVGISPATVAAVARVLKRLSAVKTPTILGWGAGRITLSMTWMTPLAAATSAWTTFELPIVTPAIKEKCWTFNENSDSKIYRKYSFELLPLETTALATSPLTKGTSPVWRSVLRTFPDTTWPRRTAFSFSGSAMRPSRAPAGRARKAASVGANRVNGPAKEKIVSLHWKFFTDICVVKIDCVPDSRVGISPATVAAVASVLNRLSAVKTPTILGWGAGRITLSMTWMTPLAAATSAWMTFELPIVTPAIKEKMLNNENLIAKYVENILLSYYLSKQLPWLHHR